MFILISVAVACVQLEIKSAEWGHYRIFGHIGQMRVRLPLVMRPLIEPDYNLGFLFLQSKPVLI